MQIWAIVVSWQAKVLPAMLAPANYMGDTDGMSASWLQTGPPVAIVDI